MIRNFFQNWISRDIMGNIFRQPQDLEERNQMVNWQAVPVPAHDGPVHAPAQAVPAPGQANGGPPFFAPGPNPGLALAVPGRANAAPPCLGPAHNAAPQPQGLGIPAQGNQQRGPSAHQNQAVPPQEQPTTFHFGNVNTFVNASQARNSQTAYHSIIRDVHNH